MQTKKTIYLHAVFFLLLFSSHVANGQAKKVILLGFYVGNYNDGTTLNTTAVQGVPCPADPNSIVATNTWFYDNLAKEANTIAKSGFNAVWLPPMAKGSLGTSGTSSKVKYYGGGIYDSGYGVFDHYDLGDKLQSGNYQTRYGSRTQLTRCIAMLHANGLDAYEDLVTNQVGILASVSNPIPPDYLWYQYKNAFDSVGGGRFPKYTPDFHNPPNGKPGAPGGTEDPDVPATTYPDGSPTGQKEGFFGPDFAHVTGEQNVHGYPGVYCATQLALWADWLIKSTGIQGYRLDDVSGISWDFLNPLVNYGSLKGKFSFTELAGAPYGAADLKEWLQSSMGQTGNNFTMLDQILQGAMGGLCNNNQLYMPLLLSKYMSYGAVNQMNPATGSINQGSLDIYRSLTVADTAQVVTVVNEIDSESGNTPILPKQCLIGYAYILTIGYGIPCVAYRDWSTDAGSYGSTMIDSNNLNYHINKLVWCHNFICTGGFTNENTPNRYIYCFQKTGGQQAMVFLNSDQHNAITVTTATSIPNGTVLTDYTDHNVNATVNNGQITITVPANVNGRGYLVMAPPGITGSFTANPTTTTQEWDGAEDLSIPPASNNEQEVCRVWVDNAQDLTGTMLYFNTANWGKTTSVTLEIDKSSLDNKTNTAVKSRNFYSNQQNQSLSYTTPATGGPGYYSFWIKGNGLPVSLAGGYQRFNLQTTYTAPQTASAEFNDTVPSLTSFTKAPPIVPDTIGETQIYPNPANSSITAEYNLLNTTPVLIKVISINGKVVLKETYAPQLTGYNTNTINIAALSPGVYVLRVQDSNSVLISKKFIKL